MEPKLRTQGANGSHKGKTSKAGLSGLENSQSGASSDTQESAQTCPTDTNDGWNCDEWKDGWSSDEWNDDWSSVGWHEGREQTYDTSASSFSLAGLDVRATSSPKRFEKGEDELGHRSCSNHIPIKLWSRGSRRLKILSDCQW